MNRINYTLLIHESEGELLRFERQQCDVKSRDRIKFIRLLKVGVCHTQQEAGYIIGVKRTQSQKIWRDYKDKGLEGLIKKTVKRGFGKLNSHQLSGLQRRLSAHDISSQIQIKEWLISEYGIHYTQAGLSLLLKRLKIKLKTGRPSNIRKDEEALQAFKKTLHV